MKRKKTRTMPGSSALTMTVQGLTHPLPGEPANLHGRLETLQSLSEPVANRLYATLPLPAKEMSEFESNLDLFRCYQESLSQLQNAQDQLANLLRSVCNTQVRANGQFGQVRFEMMVDAEVQLMMDGLQQTQLSNDIHASLADQPLVLIHDELVRGLSTSTKAVVTAFYQAIDRMVDRNVVGLVDWSSNNSCRFHYFERHVNETVHDRSVRWEASPDDVDLEQQIERQTKTNDWVLQRHTHNITDIKRFELLKIDSSGLVIPLRLRPLLAAIPRWLSQNVSLIDGQMFSESIEERPMRNERVTEEVVTGETRLASSNAVHYEPAVLLDGLFVLAAWNVDEHNLEIQYTDSKSTASRRIALTESADEFAVSWMVKTLYWVLVASALVTFGSSFVVAKLLGIGAWFCGLYCLHQMHNKRVLARRADNSMRSLGLTLGLYVGLTLVVIGAFSSF